MNKILVTGANGFIGHHFCAYIIKHTDWHIYTMDRLSYASFGYERLRDVGCYHHDRIQHFSHDFTLPIREGLRKELSDTNYIVHLGAETHVDNSITNPEPFVKSNVLGTMNILEFARTCNNLKKMIYCSTDEVFGPASAQSAPDGYREWDRYHATNPYSASKAGGEELCLAWANTYKVPVIVTHTMNVFGERQHPEKFIPKVVRKLRDNEPITIHSDSTMTIPGSRFWIHASNVSAAFLFLLEQGRNGDKYNIVGEKEVNNLEMAQYIADVLGLPLTYEMVDFHASRPGHDLRYALNGDKLNTMGWGPPENFADTLRNTILWTLEHDTWLTAECSD